MDAPSGFQPSPDNVGDDATDSDGIVNGLGQSCANVTLAAHSTTDNTIDFGFWEKPVQGPGTGTPGYWKNHPEAWPVGEITIGGVVYTKAEAIAVMESGDKDKSFTMFRHLVSAKLNVLAGNDSNLHCHDDCRGRRVDGHLRAGGHRCGSPQRGVEGGRTGRLGARRLQQRRPVRASSRLRLRAPGSAVPQGVRARKAHGPLSFVRRSAVGDHVIGDVRAGFDCELQCAFDRALRAPVGTILVHRDVAQFPELREILVECRELPQQELAINHGQTSRQDSSAR